MSADPRADLRAWLPHVLMLGALVAAIWLLAVVVSPLFEPILVAGAIAILTSPVLLTPLRGVVDRRLSRFPHGVRRKIAGIAATLTLLLIASAPLVILVVGQADNLSDLSDRVRGIVARDTETIADITDAVEDQVDEINEHYKTLNLPAEEIAASVEGFLAESQDVNSAFLSFISAGTGTLAQIVLALIALTYFYIDGPRLARGLLGYSPLTPEQQTRLIDQHRRVVLRLLNDTVVAALAKGIVLGAIVWAVDHLFGAGSLPFLPVAIVAALITLLPLVGVTLVWLPFATLAWTQGNVAGAVVLAISCWSANVALEWARGRVGNHLARSADWMGFLLFLGLIGGLLTYGPKGLIVGPFAVVMVVTIGRAWLPLYVAEAVD